MVEDRNNKCSTFDQFLENAMKDKELKEEYDKLGPEYEMIKFKIKTHQQK